MKHEHNSAPSSEAQRDENSSAAIVPADLEAQFTDRLDSKSIMLILGADGEISTELSEQLSHFDTRIDYALDNHFTPEFQVSTLEEMIRRYTRQQRRTRIIQEAKDWSFTQALRRKKIMEYGLLYSQVHLLVKSVSILLQVGISIAFPETEAETLHSLDRLLTLMPALLFLILQIVVLIPEEHFEFTEEENDVMSVASDLPLGKEYLENEYIIRYAQDRVLALGKSIDDSKQSLKTAVE